MFQGTWLEISISIHPSDGGYDVHTERVPCVFESNRLTNWRVVDRELGEYWPDGLTNSGGVNWGGTMCDASRVRVSESSRTSCAISLW